MSGTAKESGQPIDLTRLLGLQSSGKDDNFVLRFPTEIADRIGLNEKEINSFKGKGCRFYGRKTCVAWVRDYLNRVTAGSDVL